MADASVSRMFAGLMSRWTTRPARASSSARPPDCDAEEPAQRIGASVNQRERRSFEQSTTMKRCSSSWPIS